LADATAGRLGHRIELASTILLALAAVATAWATYQAAHWRSEQALAGNRSTAARVEANRAAGVASRQIIVDVETFVQWVDAYATGEEELADFYFLRFRPEFRPAVDAWVATRPLKNPNAPLTPFAMPEYTSAALAEADALEERANSEAATSARNVERADRYTLCLVLFALALFFAGIGPRLREERNSAVLVGIGWALFLGGVGWIVTFPVNVSL